MSLSIEKLLIDIETLKSDPAPAPDRVVFAKGGYYDGSRGIFGSPEEVRLFVSGNDNGGGMPSYVADRIAWLENKPAIYGPSQLAVGVTGLYTISNYDLCKTYEIEPVTPGDVLVNSSDPLNPLGSASTFNYTPMLPESSGFIVNGFQFEVAVVDPKPAKAVITSPVNGTTNAAVSNLTVTTNAFSMTPVGSEMDTHVSTDWEVATDPNFTNIVYASYEDSVNLTSIIIP